MNWWLVLAGFSASAAAGAATGLGALPVLLIARLSSRMTDAVLGFAAGVMLAASLFSLIIPGLEAAQRLHGRLSAGLIVTSAILMGAGLIALIERYAPHEHFVHGRQGRSSANVRRIWLFVIAITLHNIPEGLAVGIGYGSGDLRNGTILALAIGLQNVPEGLAVAAALVSVGYSRSTSVAVSLGTGLIEPIAGLFGAAAVSLFNPLLPWGMGFAQLRGLIFIKDICGRYCPPDPRFGRTVDARDSSKKQADAVVHRHSHRSRLGDLRWL